MISATFVCNHTDKLIHNNNLLAAANVRISSGCLLLFGGEKRKTSVCRLCPIRRLIAAGLIGDDIFVFSAGKFIVSYL